MQFLKAFTKTVKPCKNTVLPPSFGFIAFHLKVFYKEKAAPHKARKSTKLHKEETVFHLGVPSCAWCLSVRKKKKQLHTKPERAKLHKEETVFHLGAPSCAWCLSVRKKEKTASHKATKGHEDSQRRNRL